MFLLFRIFRIILATDKTITQGAHEPLVNSRIGLVRADSRDARTTGGARIENSRVRVGRRRVRVHTSRVESTFARRRRRRREQMYGRVERGRLGRVCCGHEVRVRLARFRRDRRRSGRFFRLFSATPMVMARSVVLGLLLAFVCYRCRYVYRF